jgi:hypothetical protein
MGTTAAASFTATKAALANTGATLPATDPTGGNHFYYMPQAEFKALGLSSAGYSALNALDGYIGFNSNLSLFSFSGPPPAAGFRSRPRLHTNSKKCSDAPPP